MFNSEAFAAPVPLVMYPGGVTPQCLASSELTTAQCASFLPPLLLTAFHFEQEIQTRISGASPVQVSFDSSNESSDISAIFARGRVGTKWRFFSGEADASYRDLVTKLSNNRVTVQGRFEKATNIAPEGIYPGPWFDDGILTYALNDDTAWQDRNAKPGYLGEEGSLRWVRGDVYVVSGNVDVDITYHTKLEADEKKIIETQVKAGVWPFFSFNGSSAVETNLVRVDSDTFTLKVSGTLPGASVIAASVKRLW